MTMLALNTLAYAKKLIAAGVPERQAEAQAEALAEIVEDTLATKLDIKALEAATRHDIKALENSTQRDMKELEMRLLHEMKDVEYRMVIKLGALMVVAVGAMASLQKLL